MITNSVEKKTAVQTIEAGRAELGQRLDNFLIKTLKQVPRTRIYRIIRKGEVRVNKKRIKPDYKLKLGDLIRVPPMRDEQDKSPTVAISKNWLSRLEEAILFENRHLIVINKPEGLAVHSGSGVNFGVIDIMRLLRPDSDMELVHRLDRDTSGCLILALHRQALLVLQNCVQNNTMIKIYNAVVKGTWPEGVSELSHRLKKAHMPNGERRVYADPTGQTAQTLVLNQQNGRRCSLLTIRLVTGRTHQIRVHCQAEGHEVVGDSKYGNRQFNRDMKKQGMRRLMLHASRLELPKTAYNDEVVINAPVPESFCPVD